MEGSQELKHLVIVGGSFGGLILLHYISSYFKITVLEKKEHFEWVCMQPKSMLDKNDFYADEATVKLKDTFHTHKVFGENASYIQGLLTEVVDEHTLKFKRTEGLDDQSQIGGVEEETLNFDLLVIATGANYIINEDSVEDVYGIYSYEKKKEFLNKYKTQIDQASSILVVGGGPTGCETAGELLIQYGTSKKIGLIHGQEKLLTGLPEKAGTLCQENFEKNGVKLHLNTRYDPNSEVAKEYDFVIKCIGTHTYTPFFDNDKFKDCKDHRGRIFVNDHMQVTNVNPLIHPSKQNLSNAKVFTNIY